MATTSEIDTFMPSWLRPLLKLNEYVIGITLVCYVVGFIITNVYLGSLSVTNFDVLRVRYILTGVLFVVFLSTIFLPFSGAIAIVRSENGQVKPSLFVRLAMHTFQSYGVIFLALLAIYALAGSASTPIGLPDTAPPYPSLLG